MEHNKWNVKSADQISIVPVDFVLYPFFPRGEITQIQAAGGVGKTFLACRFAADLSKGLIPNCDVPSETPKHSLFISAEDRGSIFRERLEDCGADLQYIHILDDEASAGLQITDENGKDGARELEELIKSCSAEFVIIDPLHAFIGSIDMNRVNIVRPVMQQIVKVAKHCNCAIIIISHVSKRRADENANNAGLGSVDIVNASRSVIKVTTDETGTNKNRRCVVHTKSNYAPIGESIAFNIVDMGNNRAYAEWCGTSELTKELLEAHAISHKSLPDFMRERSSGEAPKGSAEFIANILIKLGESQPQTKEVYSFQYLKEHYKGIITGKKDISDKVRIETQKRGYIVEDILTPTLDRYKIKDRGISIIRLTDISGVRIEENLPF